MFELPALVTALALIQYSVVFFRVGKARGTYKIQAPAITGHPDFERIHRVQANTLEQLVFFLPSLWLFTVYLNAPKIAAALGAVWIIGRVLYARGYYKDSAKRGPGFMIALFASVILLLGGMAGIVLHLIASSPV